MLQRNDLALAIIANTFEELFPRHRRGDGMLFSLKLHHEYDGLPERIRESYYPYVDVFLYRPGNYVKVYVRERDIHFYGAGPWVKVYDHDSGWSYECLKEILHTYQDAWTLQDHGMTNGWYSKCMPLTEGERSQRWGKLEDAFYLPALRRYDWRGNCVAFQSNARVATGALA